MCGCHGVGGWRGGAQKWLRVQRVLTSHRHVSRGKWPHLLHTAHHRRRKTGSDRCFDSRSWCRPNSAEIPERGERVVLPTVSSNCSVTMEMSVFCFVYNNQVDQMLQTSFHKEQNCIHKNYYSQQHTSYSWCLYRLGDCIVLMANTIVYCSLQQCVCVCVCLCVCVCVCRWIKDYSWFWER